jgi:2-polyprenyl-6-methoxyphenol hydroxylase-like FAD-dependent oxidoreductase
LAYWLRRYGFTPTIVERAPALRAGGYKVDIRGSAIGVLERMGILADVQRASTGMRGASFVDSANKPIATMSADFFMGREGDDVEIMRGDLAEILVAATRDVEYIFGDSITAIEQRDQAVDVTFARGRPRSFDLVVGADGLHSNVRARAFGDEAQFLRYLGCYISIFTVPNHLGLDHWELFYTAPGRLANIYSAGQPGEAKALFAFTSPQLDYRRQDIEQQKQLLAGAFAGQQWEIPRLLACMPDAPDFYFDSMSQIHMSSWSKGRVALVGDAAYCPSPASGQGTGLALVGAYVLAGELAAADDYCTAYARYEAEVRGYVEQNLTLGQKMAKEMVPASQLQIWFRNQMMRALPYLPWKGLITKGILEPLQKAANAITLKDYPATRST